jgi:hypothetical protein
MIEGGNDFMKRFRFSLFVLMMLAMAISWAGCSKPPEAEKEAAKKAMDAAFSAGAEKYAPADTEVGKKTWEAAESQMKEKKYKEAKQAYIDAKAAFEKAASAVEAGKKAMVYQANETLKTLEGAWKKLGTTAKKMEKKLKEKKKAWSADAKTIREGFAKAKEMIASAPAEAKSKLDELKALIEKWETLFKEMATTKPKTTKKKK